jgi:hypothetical protein
VCFGQLARQRLEPPGQRSQRVAIGRRADLLQQRDECWLRLRFGQLGQQRLEPRIEHRHCVEINRLANPLQ